MCFTSQWKSVPISTNCLLNVQENYQAMKKLLQLIKYERFDWQICCDLKVVGILSGLMKGYPKHQCFLCKWEGRKTELHYTDHNWPIRNRYVIGQESIINPPLV